MLALVFLGFTGFIFIYVSYSSIFLIRIPMPFVLSKLNDRLRVDWISSRSTGKHQHLLANVTHGIFNTYGVYDVVLMHGFSSCTRRVMWTHKIYIIIHVHSDDMIVITGLEPEKIKRSIFKYWVFRRHGISIWQMNVVSPCDKWPRIWDTYWLVI